LRFKLDENLPRRAARLLVDAAHDAATVADEGLVGHLDAAVAEAAAKEDRVFVTLDKDFGEPAVGCPNPQVR
jgi:predicted nuclease of predicted toxin-antitoxin system